MHKVKIPLSNIRCLLEIILGRTVYKYIVKLLEDLLPLQLENGVYPAVNTSWARHLFVIFIINTIRFSFFPLYSGTKMLNNYRTYKLCKFYLQTVQEIHISNGYTYIIKVYQLKYRVVFLRACQLIPAPAVLFLSVVPLQFLRVLAHTLS